MNAINIARSGILLVLAASLCSTSAFAGPPPRPNSISHLVESPAMDSVGLAVDMPAQLRRQVVEYSTREAPGTVVVDTIHTYLYLVLANGTALRYGIGVGREGFTWSGTLTITKKAEWPDWTPPPEMLVRQPYLPRFMAGGPGNPLGARAIHLGATVYRIHGTNDPTTIGKHVSSGCIRLTNDDVSDLYARLSVGAKVVVLPNASTAPASISLRSPIIRRAAL